jgi:hypothetical protein
MKKISFIFIILCTYNFVALGQQIKQDADSAYLQRCRNIRDAFREAGREIRAETKNKDCKGLEEYINEDIEGYKNAVTNEDKDFFMISIAQVSCPKVIDFYEKIIVSDTSEFIREKAMLYLGWIDAQSSIPFLWNYYKKSTLSTSEKVRIATTLIVLEAWDYGEQIANENCFDTTKQIVNNCAFCYDRLGNNSSIDYYRYMRKMFGEGYFIWNLVHVGDKETALTDIKAFLKKDRPSKRFELELLKMIGDEESINLIRSALDDPHESVRKYAEKILKSIDTKTNKE